MSNLHPVPDTYATLDGRTITPSRIDLQGGINRLHVVYTLARHVAIAEHKVDRSQVAFDEADTPDAHPYDDEVAADRWSRLQIARGMLAALQLVVAETGLDAEVRHEANAYAEQAGWR